MTLDEFEDTPGDEAAPIDMLEDYFDARGWSCERGGDDEIVAHVQGSWGKYELRGVWREEDHVLQFLAMPDIRVPDDKRATLYEAIGLVNEQLWLGHFELWVNSGILLFRHAALLAGNDGATLGLDQAETLVEAAIDECERFYPVFQFVLWGGKSPREAIDAALIETQGEA
ncbi:YbjN domain-containing protein [Sphingomonas flavalba]|uniref:YbjN domain-containing protein n=1 Tax=Sphingomonas flavalba TaxID=2559804 RepID=UPI00109DC7A2|nr:YbjN domain-containing protein [Sphingomonas flavalba]